VRRRRKPQQQQRKHGLQRQARNNGAPWDAPRIIAVPPLTKRPGEKQQKKDAEDAATQPLGPLPAGMEPVDLAAWTVIGNVLLNLDETFAKR